MVSGERRDLKMVNEGHHVLLAVNHSRNMVRKGVRVVLTEEETRSVEFPNGEPDYWYGEYDVEAKILEVRLGKFIIRIPQEMVLSWFMINEYQNDQKEGDQEDSV